MIAWVLRLFMFLGSSGLVLRLPAILSTILIGIGIYLILRKNDEERAILAGILFLLSRSTCFTCSFQRIPDNILSPSFRHFFLSKALDKEKLLDYFFIRGFSGVRFSVEVFSALFSVFAYLAYYLITPKDRRRTAGFLLLFCRGRPVRLNKSLLELHAFLGEIMFNGVNRKQAGNLLAGQGAAVFGSQAYLITPPLLYYIFKKKNEIWKSVAGADTGKFLRISVHTFRC